MVEGVSEVTVVGASQRAIRIVLKPEKLAEYGIAYQTVRSKLNANNYNTPGGKAKNDAMEITVRTLGKYNNINDIKQVVVANHTGRPVYISEIADVLDSWEDEDTFASANGVPCVMTFVRKQSKTNTVDVTDNVNAKMEELKHSNLPPDIIVDKVRDQSNYIRDNIADVWNAILFGGFLALLITYLFLRNFRATIIGGLCIPTSIIATFFMMKVMGFTLNNMSLMALSLAVGILIDDAIVVIENIFRHIEMGQTPFVAAKEATEELTLAILATSLSLMAVFVPIGNMGETIGQFFKQFGMTIVFATLMSLVVSFTLTPMLASRFYKNGVEEPKGKLWSRLDDFEAQTIAKYDVLLRKCIEKPKKLVLGVLAAFAVAVALVPLGIVGSEYMPRTDESAIQVNIELPTGYNVRPDERGSAAVRRLSGQGAGNRALYDECDHYAEHGQAGHCAEKQR